MRARAVDANQSRIVAALERAGVRVHDTHALGGGFTDLLAYRPATGLLKLLEVKDGDKVPSARKLTPAEKKFHARFPAVVVCNEREALAAMGLVEWHARPDCDEGVL